MISVIVPTLNEENYIANLLESLKSQTFQDFEVIVADGNSKDKTVKIAKRYKAKVVVGGSQSAGRNNGARAAKGDILVFMDADITLKKNFLKNSLREFKDKKADIACCYFDINGLSLPMKLVYQTWNRGKYLRSHTPLPDGAGQCMWVKAGVFKRLKGFDEKMRISEDVELIHRAVAKGYKFAMLNTHFKPSPRRYENVSIWRVILGSTLGGLEQLLGRPTTGRFAELIYGGWGIHNGKKIV